MYKVTALYIISELVSHKKNEIMSILGKQMKVEIIALGKISQTQEDKFYVFIPISLWMIFKASLGIRQGDTSL